MSTLRDLMNGLSGGFDQQINDALGDEVTYTPSGGAAATFNAWVEFAVVDITGQGSRSQGEQIILEVPAEKLETPSRDDRLTIALRPGRLYGPASWEPSTTGSGWRIPLREWPL